MDGVPSLDSVLGKEAENEGSNPPGGTPPGGANPPPPPLPAGATGVPPTPAPEPAPPADAFARERAGLQAAAIAERQRRQAIEGQFQELLQRMNSAPAPSTRGAPAPEPEEPPEREDYQDDVSYFVALSNWNTQRMFNDFRREQDERQRQAQEQERLQRTAASVQERAAAAVAAGRAKYPDFDPVVNTLGPVLQASPLLHRSLNDLGATTHEVAYYLGQNPMEAVRLMGISDPRQMHRELGRIEARVEASAPPPPPPPAANAPGAPPATAHRTLTQQRNVAGRFTTPSAPPAYDGPTPLNVVLDRAKKRGK